MYADVCILVIDDKANTTETPIQMCVC